MPESRQEHSQEVTQMLVELQKGNRAVANDLLPAVYDEFRKLARHFLKQERANHTLQPTALVHEAYMKLIDQSRVNWQGRAHFMAVAGQAMRRILVDHARGHLREKRGGGRQRVVLDEAVALSPQKEEDVLALDEALTHLGQLDARQAKVVELRFFAGMTNQEVAEALGVSLRTVEGEWKMARAWLLRELTKE